MNLKFLCLNRDLIFKYCNSDGEELIIPGNRQEMLEFIEAALHGSRVQLEINLPCASIQIPSKRIYEQLYNRFNTDLFLWEPSAPRPKYSNMENHIGLDLASTLLQEPAYVRQVLCKEIYFFKADSLQTLRNIKDIVYKQFLLISATFR